MKSIAKVSMTYSNTDDVDTFEMPAGIKQLSDVIEAARRNLAQTNNILKSVVVTITLEKD